MDQGWIKLGYIRGNVLGPFPGSGMAIGSCHRAPKWTKIAINGPFGAISRSGGSKQVDQCGSRLDHVEAHLEDVLGPWPWQLKTGNSTWTRLDQVRIHLGRGIQPFPEGVMAIMVHEKAKGLF